MGVIDKARKRPGGGAMRWCSIALGMTATTLANPAAAWDFDEATGRLDSSDADFAVSFDTLEDIPEGHDFVVSNEDFRPIPPDDLGELFESDADGLEGRGAFSFGGETVMMSLGLEPLAEQFAGRRVEVRLWQRPRGTRAVFDLAWSLLPDQGFMVTTTLHQTGRVTDDGWEEWSSGPVDWTVAGLRGAMQLVVFDAQVLQVGAWFGRFDADLRTQIDALEIIDLGPAAVPTAACHGTNERSVCGDVGLCFSGRCIDSAILVGSAPTTNAGIRDDYLSRRSFEYRTFEGGRLPRTQTADLAETLDGLRAAPSRDFWPTFADAVEQLRDGHASAASMTRAAPFSTGVCLHIGEADLLPEGGHLPLVFSASGRDPLSAVLREGDVLEAIDGDPPLEWARTMTRLIHFPADPGAFDVTVTPGLLGAAIAVGSTLTFARCEREGTDRSPCTEEEIERFTFDLAELVGAAIWEGDLPEWLFDEPPGCDFRFRRALDDHDVTDYSYAGVADEEGITTLLINGVPSYWEDGGRDWFDTASEACIPPPEIGLILDQRTGSGGAIGTTDYLAAMLVGTSDFFAMDLYPTFDRELDEDLRDVLLTCMWSGSSSCGGAWRWPLGQAADQAPTRDQADEVPVAILNSLDVSGNDFTTRLISYRSGPTRIFGPAPTWGAFGPIYSMPTHFDEVAGGTMQWHDTLFLQSSSDDTMDFATGTGVVPQELVYQRQSDALQGIDTIVEAARTWLAEEGT